MYPAYWYLESGTREEFAIKKVNFCYLCNGHGNKEPCDLTMFLQNGLLFSNFYFEQKKLSFLLLYLYQLHILTFLISTLLLSLFLLQTNFSVEEVKVYEKLEDHPHLVTHYAVAFSGEHKKVNIFMELCGMFFSCCLSLSVDYNAFFTGG